MLKAEADWLRSQGLGQRATSRDLLVFDDQGPVDNPLRFPDECVRHKLLDLVGDLALAGCDLMGHFVAHRSGHRLNAELVRVLLSEGELVRHWRRTA
jgi:UDP-3-O-acyl-N-acetylglucosamine deacetylase